MKTQTLTIPKPGTTIWIIDPKYGLTRFRFIIRVPDQLRRNIWSVSRQKLRPLLTLQMKALILSCLRECYFPAVMSDIGTVIIGLCRTSPWIMLLFNGHKSRKCIKMILFFFFFPKQNETRCTRQTIPCTYMCSIKTFLYGNILFPKQITTYTI